MWHCLEVETNEGNEIHLLSANYVQPFQHFISQKENITLDEVKHCSAWLPHHSCGFLVLGIHEGVQDVPSSTQVLR